jgi:hypothetical protein
MNPESPVEAAGIRQRKPVTGSGEVRPAVSKAADGRTEVNLQDPKADDRSTPGPAAGQQIFRNRRIDGCTSQKPIFFDSGF